MSEAELRKVLELLNEAYKAAGQEIQTAVLYEDDKETILIDNRDEEDIN